MFQVPVLNLCDLNPWFLVSSLGGSTSKVGCFSTTCLHIFACFIPCLVTAQNQKKKRCLGRHHHQHRKAAPRTNGQLQGVERHLYRSCYVGWIIWYDGIWCDAAINAIIYTRIYIYTVYMCVWHCINHMDLIINISKHVKTINNSNSWWMFP